VGGPARAWWPRLAWLVPIWAVPIVSLVVGRWPFGLIAALALTAWVLADAPRYCARCGRRLY